MPINKIIPTKRGKAAIAAMFIAAAASGWAAFTTTHGETPQSVRAAIAQGITPAPVQLAIDKLIKPWEGVELKAYLDVVKVPTICWGETKGVKLGMVKTLAECDAMLKARVINDYYLPLVDGVRGYTSAPDSVQASLLSGAYNFGVGNALRSTAARKIGERRYVEACEAQTAFNKAGKKIVRGLVNRREMGDAQRLGEAELCVSGL